jgi:hypothetical protein
MQAVLGFLSLCMNCYSLETGAMYERETSNKL